MKKRAKFKRVERWEKGYQGIRVTTLIYEYRGREYEIEDNPWDRFSNPLWIQHKRAQDEIDEALDNPKPQEEKEHRYEDTADYAFNKLFDYWENGGEWED